MPQQIITPRPARAATPVPGLVTAVATIGAVAAGAALLEVALLPGVAIGAAAVLAGREIAGPLGLLLRRLAPPPRGPGRRLPISAEPVARPGILPHFAIKRSLAKTVTYRIIVTGIDFSWNFVIIGELATAAGLSAFSLLAGPFFYFVHEAGWNYFTRAPKAWDGTVQTGILRLIGVPVSLSRTMTKTIVFRFFATTNEFAANYLVIGDLTTATVLTAPGFIIGPFLYFGHEKFWERFLPESAATEGRVVSD